MFAVLITTGTTGVVVPQQGYCPRGNRPETGYCYMTGGAPLIGGCKIGMLPEIGPCEIGAVR